MVVVTLFLGIFGRAGVGALREGRIKERGAKEINGNRPGQKLNKSPQNAFLRSGGQILRPPTSDFGPQTSGKQLFIIFLGCACPPDLRKATFIIAWLELKTVAFLRCGGLLTPQTLGKQLFKIPGLSFS